MGAKIDQFVMDQVQLRHLFKTPPWFARNLLRSILKVQILQPLLCPMFLKICKFQSQLSFTVCPKTNCPIVKNVKLSMLKIENIQTSMCTLNTNSYDSRSLSWSYFQTSTGLLINFNELPFSQLNENSVSPINPVNLFKRFIKFCLMSIMLVVNVYI